MALRKYKPTTPGTRWRVGNAYEEITTNKPEKSLLAPMRSKGGRNSKGRMTMRNLGGGHKKHYRIVDFKRNKHEVPATVKTIEYDPNRSAFIALLHYADGEKRYIIAPQGIEVGATIVSGEKAAPELGNALLLKNIPDYLKMNPIFLWQTILLMRISFLPWHLLIEMYICYCWCSI